MENVIFQNAGLQLVGTLHRPPHCSSNSLPGLILCHGFGGNSDGAGHPTLAQGLAEVGYIVLRFDFRGCGKSGGEPGRVIFAEEVEDLKAAITLILNA